MRDLLDALVPPRCAGCGDAGSWLCPRCVSEGDPVVVHSGPLIVRGVAAHEGPLREAVHRFKYSGERGLAAELGALVARLIAGDLAGGVALDAVVAVPLHPDRARARGYDQAALLAAEAAARVGLPRSGGLYRVRPSRPQVDLDRAERSRNVEGAFVAVAGSLDGVRVALVDDVATTGATLRAAADAALAAGAAAVRAYVVTVDA